MPKAEIHIHLEGSIAPETLLTLAERHDRLDTLPGTDIQSLRDWYVFRDFPHFVVIYGTIMNLLRSTEDFELVAYQCGADMAAQNIRYREITCTPYTHTHRQTEKGVTIGHILNGLSRGAARAKADFGVEMRWVFDIARDLGWPDGAPEYSSHAADVTLEYAIEGMNYGVVGFGLGGYEVNNPPEPFAHAFTAAKEAGLMSVPHAGETVGPSSVWGAINTLGAERIGHGVRAIEDPHLLAILKEKQIPLEVNMVSNVCLGVYDKIEHHPFPHLDKMGLFVTLNSDDPPMFNTTLTREFEILATEFGYSQHDLARIARRAFTVTAAEPEVKNRLLTEFDAWATNNLSE